MSRIQAELSSHGGRHQAAGRISDPRQLELNVSVPEALPVAPPEPIAPLPPRANPLRVRHKPAEPEAPPAPEFPPAPPAEHSAAERKRENGEPDAMEAQSQAQLEALRKELAAIARAREEDRQNLHLAETRCSQLEARLRAAEAASGERKTARDQTPHAIDDLREQFQHYEQKLKAKPPEDPEKLRVFDDRTRQSSARLDEALQALEAEKRKCAEESARTEGLERRAAEQQAQAEARLQEAMETIDRERQQRAADSTRFRERESQLVDQLGASHAMAREAAAPIARRPGGIAPALAVTGMLILLAVASGLSFSLGRADRTSSASQGVGVAPAAPAETPMAAEARQAVAPAPAATAKPAPKLVPWPAISIKGIQAKSGEHSLVLTFESGVFARRTEITDQAKQDLRRLAAQLKPSGDRFRLEIEGHTDAAPVSTDGSFADNRELGLRRAKAALEFLQNEGGLPAAIMTATSAGEEDPPYPNTTPESRRKNRTVVLKITRSLL